MNTYLSTMTAEMGARRKRLRAAFGDRAQTLVEFLVLSGLALGSLGLLIAPWMPGAAPWGLAMPLVFVIGFVVIENQRQRAIDAYRRQLPAMQDELDRNELNQLLVETRRQRYAFETDEDMQHKEANVADTFWKNTEERHQQRVANTAQTLAPNFDWAVFIWSCGCAVMGAAAFFIAWQARPAPPPAPPPGWQPPSTAVSVDLPRPD